MARSAGKEDAIVIYRSANGDGETYSLKPSSADLLRSKFGTVHIRPRLFIANETRADYQKIHGDIVPQIVALLTGLSQERLKAIGVTFRDAVTERDLPVQP